MSEVTLDSSEDSTILLSLNVHGDINTSLVV